MYIELPFSYIFLIFRHILPPWNSCFSAWSGRILVVDIYYIAPAKPPPCMKRLNIKSVASAAVSWLYNSGISLERHNKKKKIIVWVDSSVVSNHFKRALTSIWNQPHTETTLRHHQEGGGADDIFPSDCAVITCGPTGETHDGKIIRCWWLLRKKEN